MNPPEPLPLSPDHLVLGCRTLDEGARWLEARLGLAPDPGGRHPGFGSHNRLLSLGEGLYLEMLAPDPSQPAPERARLFGLDDPATRERLAHGPALLHWVVRVRTPELLDATRDDPVAASVGRIVTMTRDALSWRIALREDGHVPPGGLPTPIDWGPSPHPCTRLPDRGVRLLRADVSVTPDALNWLGGRMNDPRFSLHAADRPRLQATLRGPDGREAQLAG